MLKSRLKKVTFAEHSHFRRLNNAQFTIEWPSDCLITNPASDQREGLEPRISGFQFMIRASNEVTPPQLFLQSLYCTLFMKQVRTVLPSLDWLVIYTVYYRCFQKKDFIIKIISYIKTLNTLLEPHDSSQKLKKMIWSLNLI